MLAAPVRVPSMCGVASALAQPARWQCGGDGIRARRGQQPAVANSLEPAGHHMQQEATHELFDVQPYHLVAQLVTVVHDPPEEEVQGRMGSRRLSCSPTARS